MTTESDLLATFSTYARGKLLLSGEYFVLDGAWALATPVKFGQHLKVFEVGGAPLLHWESRLMDGSIWYQGLFSLPDFFILEETDKQITATLLGIFNGIEALRPNFFTRPCGLSVQTQLDFPREWGLGTSSTLISAMSRWAGVDPYEVLFRSMGGSGYDLACAYSEGPIFYRLHQGTPAVAPALFSPDFRDALYFVYLGRKQDSRAAIRQYREIGRVDAGYTDAVSDLSFKLAGAADLSTFEALIDAHEQLVGSTLKLPVVRDHSFPDYWGSIKSLGAWGGDFVLATSDRGLDATKSYFIDRGYPTVLRWSQMV